MDRAIAALRAEPDLAAVFGRRRERFPQASLYNQQCDDEWNVPIGYVASCGGDAMFRVTALSAVGDYNPDLIAGEEPDLCLRLSREEWKIKRIDAEMTQHDAALTRFSQWWRRARRSGHAYAEHVWRHGAASIPSWRRQVSSILIWGLAIPLVALVLLGAKLFGYPAGLAGLAVLALNVTGPVGIDLESLVLARGASALSDTCLAPAEKLAREGLPSEEIETRFLAFWTAKEAAVKLTGTGWSVDPRSVVLRLTAGLPDAVLTPPARLIPVPVPGHLCHIALPHGMEMGQ